MMVLPITLSIAAAAGLLNLWAGARVSQVRLREKISIGDGGHELLTRRMRAQANLVEYAPIVLILLGAIELAIGSPQWLWAVGAAFIVGRVLHLFGMDGGQLGFGRRIGILLTMLILLGLALLAAYVALTSGKPA